MSMLKSFFEIGTDKRIFDGLNISEEKELCEKYMGRFPVISISLKGINADCFETARDMAVSVINAEAARFQFLLESNQLTDYDKNVFLSLLDSNMKHARLYTGIRDLSSLLSKHFHSNVILLIDEYEVPLAKAYEQGYYDQMVLLIRNMFEHALKTNDCLEFAVLTGCMRIAKESIFTGLNNLRILTISDKAFDEYYGFTDKEVQALLTYYGLSEHYDTIREWYDGYQFGNTEVYCPWDVINYCSLLRTDPYAQPRDFWSNTSGNDAVKRFIRQADNDSTKREIERLVAGEMIKKEIHQELTYRDMYQNIDNIWSVLYTTGYLTQRGRADGDCVNLVIPNMEIRRIFTRQIMEYFKETVCRDGEMLNAFCEALQNGEEKRVETLLQSYLRKTISIRDTFVKKRLKENYYQGILIGLLGYKESWAVFSNKETGDGYSDILIEIEEEEKGIIIELKYAEDGNLDSACQDALNQIEKNTYEEQLYHDGMEHILKYGIAFHKKRCRVFLK